MFNEISERNTVIVQHGQKGTFQSSITREQAACYFARRDAYLAAHNKRYSTSVSIGQSLDTLIAKGFITVTQKGRWTSLSDGKGNRYNLGSKIERDYILCQLNMGKFAKTY